MNSKKKGSSHFTCSCGLFVYVIAGYGWAVNVVSGLTFDFGIHSTTIKVIQMFFALIYVSIIAAKEKRDHRLYLPYLIVIGTFLIAGICAGIFASIYALADQEKWKRFLREKENWGVILFRLLAFLVECWLYYIVYRAYKYTKNEQVQDGSQAQPTPTQETQGGPRVQPASPGMHGLEWSVVPSQGVPPLPIHYGWKLPLPPPSAASHSQQVSTLWGQPPQQNTSANATTQPTSLNALMSEHFQPLTGGVGPSIQQQPPQPPTMLAPSIASAHQQGQQQPKSASAMAAAAVGTVTSMATTTEKFPMEMPTQAPQPLFNQSTLLEQQHHRHHPNPMSPPVTMAEIAQQFEAGIGLGLLDAPTGLEPLPRKRQPTVFNANSDAGYPSLESIVVKQPESPAAITITSTPLVESTTATTTNESTKGGPTVKSFANIAAKTLAAFATAVNNKMTAAKTMIKQPVSAGSVISAKQQQMQQNGGMGPTAAKSSIATTTPEPAPLNKAVTRPTKVAMPMTTTKMTSQPAAEKFSMCCSTSTTPPAGLLDNMRQASVCCSESSIAANGGGGDGPDEDNTSGERAALAKQAEDEEAEKKKNEENKFEDTHRRKSSVNAEHLSHRPSPSTDDGFYTYNNQQQGQGSNSGGASARNTHLDKGHIFYRTHICAFWQAHREGKGPPCKHGDRCFYAHGEKKLQKLNPQFHKTQLCKNYYNGEECPYGINCYFAHGVEDLRKAGPVTGVVNNINLIGKQQNRFFSVPHRYELRKQQCEPTAHGTDDGGFGGMDHGGFGGTHDGGW